MKKIFNKKLYNFLIIKIELSIFCEEYSFIDITNFLFNI